VRTETRVQAPGEGIALDREYVAHALYRCLAADQCHVLPHRDPPTHRPVRPPASRPGRQHDRDVLLSKLSDREQTVFAQLAAGLSNREIATKLHLSEGTVKVHVGRILAKLDLRDRVQAVVLAYESGLITSGS